MASKQSHGPKTSSKRQALRDKRVKEQARNRNLLIILVAAVVIVVAAIVLVPQLINASKPVGAITAITPVARPQASGTSAGNPNAKIKVDVYEDFQCPICRQYTQTVEPQLMDNEVKAGTVYYTFHNFPFIDQGNWSSVNKESHQAANAAMCAADQGRFWDFHDILFANWTGENVGDFSDKRLVAFAQSLGLDMTKFNSCFSANSFQSKIDGDLALGQSLGVTGTPTVYVNGKEVTPGQAPSYDQLKAAIAAAQ